MLVLTRKRSEMIRIGDDIVVKIIQTGRGAVKIGIEAPQNVRVLRSELCEGSVPPAPYTAKVPAITSLADRLRMRKARQEGANSPASEFDTVTTGSAVELAPASVSWDL